MATIVRGKFKPDLFNRPICTDDSDKLRFRQLAQKDFKKQSVGDEEGPLHVASSDMLDEVMELGDPPLHDSDGNRTER